MKRILIIIAAAALIAGCAAKDDSIRMPADQSLEVGKKLLKDSEYTEAVRYFEHSIKEAASPETAMQAQIYLADTYFVSGNYAEAIPAYELYLEIYPDSKLEPKAMLNLALCYYNQITTVDRDMEPIEKALKYFSMLAAKYPDYGTRYKPKDKVEELRIMLAQRELYVLEFYLRIGEGECAERRMNYLENHYSELGLLSEGYFKLGEYFEDEGKDIKASNYLLKYVETGLERERLKEVREMLEDIRDRLMKKQEKDKLEQMQK